MEAPGKVRNEYKRTLALAAGCAGSALRLAPASAFTLPLPVPMADVVRRRGVFSRHPRIYCSLLPNAAL